MTTRHSPAALNRQVDDSAAVAVEVSFHSADPGFTGANEVLTREAVTYADGGDAGAHPLQVAADGRAWTQMLEVAVPSGTTVTHVCLWYSDGSCSVRDIPPVTGPLDWTFSVPLVASTNL